VFNVRVFASCAPQNVDEAAVLALTSSDYVGTETTPRPHVINNSWGTDGNSTSPWIGSETECQLYDANAYSDAQLNVFAASNDGPASGTIGKQPSAKNVLTVGSVVDYDATTGLPGNLWSSSSRGPTGDNRWKPNVVAPGRWITSADAFNLTGYTEKSGTSMAAPHVTGVVSQLIDSDAAFAYLPERISAHLMATAIRKDSQLLSLPSDAHLDQYGAGRVDATRAIWGSGGTDVHWAFSLNAGGSTYYDFTVPAGATRLIAVMHYVEPPASSGASAALINDWDFYLDQPPIDPAGNTGEWVFQQSSVDNTEIRILDNPIEGTWRWKVWPDSTTSQAYFGVTIYVLTVDPTPAFVPDLSTSSYYVKPFEAVQMDYEMDTIEGTLSAVYLDSTVSSASLISSRTYLKDGVWTNLTSNEQSGWDLLLGNIDPYFVRNAQWDLYWTTEGFKPFSVRARSDNASNDGHVYTTYVTVDGTVPGPVTSFTSPSHTPGVWSNDPTIDFTWTPAVDPVSGGVASGLDGYGALLTLGGPATPTQVKNFGNVSSYTTPPRSTSLSGHYFNLRAVDRSDNWGPSASSGGYLIDTILPTNVLGLTSTTHAVGVPSCSTSMSVVWAASGDAHSGLAGYGVSVNTNPTADATPFANIFVNNVTIGFPSTPTTWYVHVRSIDHAGNASPTAHLGPFPIDPDPVTVYCTAKKNSVGCIPAIGTLNAPSYSGGAFEVIAKNVVNNKSGLLFWGYTPSAVPFQGGIKCVLNPVKRTPLQNSGGNPPPNDCSGTYSFNFDTAYMAFKGIAPGDTLYAQYWSRDPLAPFTTGLTDAVKFTVCQ
jgi:hypothetical protein